MNKSYELVLVLTASKIIVDHIQAELEANGIGSITKDEFRQGLEAGFGAGSPSAIDLFVLEPDVEKALEIINAITT